MLNGSKKQLGFISQEPKEGEDFSIFNEEEECGAEFF
jgi:hypothetical protein